MIQKLPTTEGDSITLGSIVAFGKCSNQDKKYILFITFECNGVLNSYEVNADLFEILSEAFCSNSDALINRDDLKFTRLAGAGYRIQDLEGGIVDEFEDLTASPF